MKTTSVYKIASWDIIQDNVLDPDVLTSNSEVMFTDEVRLKKESNTLSRLTSCKAETMC